MEQALPLPTDTDGGWINKHAWRLEVSIGDELPSVISREEHAQFTAKLNVPAE